MRDLIIRTTRFPVIFIIIDTTNRRVATGTKFFRVSGKEMAVVVEIVVEAIVEAVAIAIVVVVVITVAVSTVEATLKALIW
jgi:hypothetical protein